MADSKTASAGIPSPAANQLVFSRGKTRPAKALYQTFLKTMDDLLGRVRSFRRLDVREPLEILDWLLKQVQQDSSGMLRAVCDKRPRSQYEPAHALNVCILCTIIGRAMNLSNKELLTLGLGGLLHDLGKTFVPERILSKPGELTREEFDLVKQHPARGRELLAQARSQYPNFSKIIAPAALLVVGQHHERLDGSGYPAGIVGRRIHTFSRIAALADVYDALTNDRAYNNAIQRDTALAKIFRFRDKGFDADLVARFVRHIGIYPVGTAVMLKSEDVGVVVELNPKDALCPKVKVLGDALGNPVASPYVVDLSVPDFRKMYGQVTGSFDLKKAPEIEARATQEDL